MSTTQVFPSVTWSAGPGCHGGCGQKLYVEDGKLVRVEGDEKNPWNQGRSCPRVLALKQYMYHPDRITTPLLRDAKELAAREGTTLRTLVESGLRSELQRRKAPAGKFRLRRASYKWNGLQPEARGLTREQLRALAY